MSLSAYPANNHRIGLSELKSSVGRNYQKYACLEECLRVCVGKSGGSSARSPLCCGLLQCWHSAQAAAFALAPQCSSWSRPFCLVCPFL